MNENQSALQVLL